MEHYIVAWDMGGTKCTVGLIHYNLKTHDLTCLRQYTLPLARAHSLPNLINQLEAGLQFSMQDASAICIGAAGHYDGFQLHHAHAYAFPMNFAEVAKQYHWPHFAVIHDYSPIVCATFTSYITQANNVKRLNQSAVQPYARRVAFGIGTGLGLKDGILFEDGNFWLGHNEIGHIGITAPPSADAHMLNQHNNIMEFLREKQAHALQPITFESILTGKGMANLYQFFYPSQTPCDPESVGNKVRAGLAPEVASTFAWYLGLFVGTVQLIFMPEGGIWITGGVTLRHLDLFDQPEFQAGIATLPAYLSQREQYPLGILCNNEHALLGGGYYAVKRLLPTHVGAITIKRNASMS